VDKVAVGEVFPSIPFRHCSLLIFICMYFLLAGETDEPDEDNALSIMRDAERLGVRNWTSKAKDRVGWRRLLESAKTLDGL
jgi:hypothetical protein